MTISLSRFLCALMVLSVATASAHVRPEGITVVVGSGGCDGQDSHCHDKPSEENLMTFITIADNGTLRHWTNVAVPASAAWFAVKHGRAGFSNNCLYAMFPGSSSIKAFQWFADSLPTEVQTLQLDDVNANPVHGDISSDGNTLIVANYHGPDDQTNSTGAGVQTFSISEDCKIKMADLKPHHGSSVDKARQGAAHPHSAVHGPNNTVFVCDLGMDEIFTYRVHPCGMLTEISRMKTPAGTGPRHSVVHPDHAKQYLFVVTEMGNLVLTYRYDSEGKLTQIGETSSLPAADQKANETTSKAAEIAITPDGKHLYVSNRVYGEGARDSIVVFDVSENATLSFTQSALSPRFPRGMTLMPDGRFLLAASQSTGDVVSFQVDTTVGKLKLIEPSTKGPLGAAAFAILSAKANGYVPFIV
jgi:6-phosphogluconolactonase (cycloisomerase 2 family)